MGACREMRLPRSESESQSMSPSAALDSFAAAAAPAPATPAAGQSSSTSTEDRCFAGFAYEARRVAGHDVQLRRTVRRVLRERLQTRTVAGRRRRFKSFWLICWPSPRFAFSRAAPRQLPFRYASHAGRTA